MITHDRWRRATKIIVIAAALLVLGATAFQRESPAHGEGDGMAAVGLETEAVAPQPPRGSSQAR